MSFQNKVIIVTGGSSGIGARTALHFAEEGGRVVIIGRNVTKLKTVEESSRKIGNKVHVIQADVSKDDDARRIIEETIDTFGKLDILVNNAGIIRNASILDGKLFDYYDEIMNINLRSVVFLTTLAAPYLIKTKGNIINISSIGGKASIGIHHSTYMISKAGLDHFSRGAALELGAHGVRVNIVSPGPTVTDIFDNAGASEVDITKFAIATVLNRVSTCEEVAKLIVFLASDAAVGITGSDFVVDNGCLIK